MDRTCQNFMRAACLPAGEAVGKKKQLRKKGGAAPALRFKPFRLFRGNFLNQFEAA
jgi:hypothetical protein